MLDNGEILTAHSQFIAASSEVLKAALACEHASEMQDEQETASMSTVSSAGKKLPLPNTSKEQVLLLLHCLYTFNRESWAKTLSSSDLFSLAEIAHRFACQEVLSLADSTLCNCHSAPTDHTAPAALVSGLTPVNAPELYKAAQTLHLTQYESHVGCYLGKHADEVDLEMMEPSCAHIMRGAIQARGEVLKSMQPG